MGRTPPALQLVKHPDEGRVVHAGEVLEGRYRLQKIIGDGGMGTVFLAEHVLIQRRVAIKVLHRDLAHDSEVVERFMNEARAAGTLGHPNIVESTDMGFARDEVPYIVFEYLEGSALSDEIYRLGGLTVRRALKIAYQIASALDAAHRASIIHRDLKSDNIFLTDKEGDADHVKVLDFGISRFLEAEQDRTGRGSKRGPVMMGTPEFMAPEQIMSPDRVDARTDVYALGVVLYEMLAGRTPFVDENKHDPHELLHKIVLDRPPPLAREDLPAGFSEMLFEKLLVKEPEARYQSMADVQGALDAFLGVMKRNTLREADPPSLPVAAHQVALPAAPKHRVWPYVLATLMLAGGAVGYALWPLTIETAPPAAKVAAPAVDPTIEQAQLLGNALDGAATAAQLRVDGLATSPMLRAAIETDAATLADMARDGAVVAPLRGETLEVFQDPATSLLRLPATATALPVFSSRTVHIVARGSSLVVVAGAAVLKTSGARGGSISLAAPIDLDALVPQVASRSADIAVRDGVLYLGTVPVTLKNAEPTKE